MLNCCCCCNSTARADPEPRRQVIINGTDQAFCDNTIITYKYSVNPFRLNFFLWKNLFEQFQRIANIYFLFIVILQLIPGISPVGTYTTLAALVFVMGVSAIKSAYEDYKRHQSDKKLNNQPAHVLKNGVFTEVKWYQIRAGDIVKLVNYDDVPADMVLLSTSEEEGMAYVETSNLDGETNLKPKCALQESWPYKDESTLTGLSGLVECEAPNKRLYEFTGVLSIVHDGKTQQISLDPMQLILRGSQLRKAGHVFGLVIYTGQETKVMKNASHTRFKRSRLEHKVDKMIIMIFILLFILVVIAASVYMSHDFTTMYYLQWDPNKAGQWWLSLLTFIVLLQNLVPISLYVSMELVRFFQGAFLGFDVKLYHAPSDMPAMAHTTALNEELGQVNMIFSDKTGTLTRNCMKLFKFSVNGTAYGHGLTDIGRAAVKRRGIEPVDDRPEACKTGETPFWDPRILDGKWHQEPHPETLEEMFLLLSLCHSAMADEKGVIQAESPDEYALLEFASLMGYRFVRRGAGGQCVVHTEGKGDQIFGILNMLAFTSERRRMSVVCRTPEGKLLLYSKGADSVMLPRIRTQNLQRPKEHLMQFGEEGLRTLVCAKKELVAAAYDQWNQRWTQAKHFVGERRQVELDRLAAELEVDLDLICVTGIEDKLQQDVPQTIARLRSAGVRIWILTGDKLETAVNIGFACDLLHTAMRLVTLDNPHEVQQRLSAESMPKVSVCGSGEPPLPPLPSPLSTATTTELTPMPVVSTYPQEIGLVVDGDCLTSVLANPVLFDQFYALASRCPAVVCCRMSPDQKANVVLAMKRKDRSLVTLAIGDGANDVSMIQAAHVGIGISGMEGVQARNASDYALGQFSFLYRLLMVHGRWCYRRLSLLICYSFYKNILLYLTQFYFLFYNGWSGFSIYDAWIFGLYNIVFTALPIIIVGIFDRDMIDPDNTARFPKLYEHGLHNYDFNIFVFVRWVLLAIGHGLVCFLVPLYMCKEGFFITGRPMELDGLGNALVYTCIICVVNLELCLYTESWTHMHHGAMWPTIATWFIFDIVYGYIFAISPQAYMAFIEHSASPHFWGTLFVVILICILPEFLWLYASYNLLPVNKMLLYRWLRIAEHGGRPGLPSPTEVPPLVLCPSDIAPPPVMGDVTVFKRASASGELPTFPYHGHLYLGSAAFAPYSGDSAGAIGSGVTPAPTPSNTPGTPPSPVRRAPSMGNDAYVFSV